MSLSSSIVIEEVTQAGSPGRSVTLTGSALPFQGTEWGTANQIVTSWPAGSTEGTQQILGPRELPATWQGAWSRPLLGRTPAKYDDGTGSRASIVAPHLLFQLIEDIVRGGMRLRVTWSFEDLGGEVLIGADGQRTTRAPDPTASGKIVREGRCKEFKQRFPYALDVEWDASWEWVSRGPQQQKVAAVRDDSAIAAATAVLSAYAAYVDQQARETFLRKNPVIPRSAGTLSLGQLERFANAPLAAVTSLTRNLQQQVTGVAQAAGIARTLTNLPFAIAGQLVAAATNTVDVANHAVDRLTSTPSELLTLSDRAADLVRSASYYSRTRARTVLLARAAEAAAGAVRGKNAVVALQGKPSARTVKMRPGDVVAVHIVKAGETPQRLSQRYYDTPDHGRDILRANRLPLYQVVLPAGRAIIIPVLQTAQPGA